MSAITTHIEQQSEPSVTDPCKLREHGGLGEGLSVIPEIANSHNGLVRMLWIRRTLEDLLKGRQICANGHSIKITPGVGKYDIPWFTGVGNFSNVGIFGKSGKMQCPTWDLPAGSPLTGGSCIGATAGQSTVPAAVRRPQSEYLKTLGVPVRLREAICQICYAEGGNYASPHVQVGEMIRYWWTQQMLYSTPENAEYWVQAVTWALKNNKIKAVKDPVTEAPIKERHLWRGKPLRPVRIHSSGDFFDHRYARAWVEVCNRCPEFLFWAPTRTWAYPGWGEEWPKILQGLKHGNLVVRPSTFHTGDTAPHANAGGMGLIAGTTSVYGFDKRDPETRFDWQCPTYAVKDDAASCLNSTFSNEDGSGDGLQQCRACWLQPTWRVNYTAH